MRRIGQIHGRAVGASVTIDATTAALPLRSWRCKKDCD
jgi:hypothetical protein